MNKRGLFFFLQISALGCGVTTSEEASIGSRRAAVGYLEQAVLPINLGQPNDQFGHAVGISGDTMIIGAPYEDTVADGSGAAYIYTRSSGAWSFQQKLWLSNGTTFDSFGKSVSIDGDTAVVGALGYGSTGGAFVYTRSAGVWNLQKTLTPGITSSNYGQTVAVSGDLVAVGAPLSDNPSNSGSVFVYTRGGGAWPQLSQLFASDAEHDDQLGSSLALAGTTVLAGAPKDNEKGISAGAAYAFTYDGSTWSEHKLTAADAAAGDQFGHAVAITDSALAGRTLLIGSPYDDDLGTESGSAYLFAASAGGYAQVQKILPSDGAAIDHFGWGVALDESGAAIGAPHNDDLGSAAGAAYLYAGGALLSERQKIHASNGAANHLYGYAVASDGTTAIIGAPGAFSSAGNAYAQVSSDTCVVLARTPAQPTVAVDSYIVSDVTDPTKANTNFGATTSLHAGWVSIGYRQSLLRFDLSVLPPGAALTLERLFLRKANSLGTGTVNVHAITAPWLEGTVTWNSFAGAFNAAPFASFQPSLTPNGSDVMVDVLGVSLPQGVLLDHAAAGRVQIGASEAAVLASRPRLLVCYQ